MSDVKKVAIGIPNEAYIQTQAYDNHLTLAFHLGRIEELWRQEERPIRYEFYWHTVGRLLTPMAREILIQRALDGGMDYVIMLDSDMLFPLDTIECLLQDMEEHPEIDILAPLAFMRNPPHYAVMYTTTEGYDSTRRQAYYTNQFVKNYPKDQLVECDAVGFGAVCIRTAMLRRLKPPYCFSTTGSGEDVWLCHKAKKEAGARIFMDTRIKLGHLGDPKVVDEEYREQYVKDNKEEVPSTPHKYSSER